MADRIRIQAHIDGLVQGVGFRPFVHTLATALGLGGQVGNDEAGVFVEVEGAPGAVDEFLARLRREHPPLAVVDRVTITTLLPTGTSGFQIAASRPEGASPAQAAGPRGLVPPDVATCAACLRELADPADRRHAHPFINCTDCGPRFSIVTDLPYDRPYTTMARFALCAACQEEYGDPADRRFHAQPIACHQCGPAVRLVGRDGQSQAGDPVDAAAALLRAGEVVAVKGIGGYHLAADATSEPAVAGLRASKHRPHKPFAVMVTDLEAAARLCRLTPADERLLSGARRPIVLLHRRPGAALAGAVAPGSRRLGVMLPYTPLHHLLLAATGRPLVLTSGNASDEPIAHRDEVAAARLGPIAGAILGHDRPIHTRVDDSVACTFRDRPMLLRRSRGYVPQPLTLPRPAQRPVLACGAELKNTFCLAEGGRAFLSPHLGDLTNHESFQAYQEQINQMSKLLRVEPELVAHDLHPDYLSTRYALATAAGRLELVGVQHHHAHVASCLVDNATDGPVIGVAFDGMGYGPDGTLWGGELLVADLASYRRAGHLVAVPVPGGDSAVRQPWRMAVSYLDVACDGQPPELELLRRHAGRWPQVRQLAARGGALAPLSSSAGRLCDAVAAILGVRDQVSYEGQAAIELEQLADPAHTGAYPASIEPGGGGQPLRIRGSDLVAAVVTDLRRGVPEPMIAARFHNGLAGAVIAACQRVREQTGLERVALTGGVFQNLLLLSRSVNGLAAAGFEVLTHSRVPPNDGGISLGQAAVAANLGPYPARQS